MRHLLFLPVSILLIALGGCALGPASAPVLDAAPDALHGTVFGGQNPVSGASVSVYAVGTSGYGTGATKYATVTTDATGSFNFPAASYTCPSSTSQMYLVVTGSSTSVPANTNLVLMAGIGPCAAGRSLSVNVNEVTTAATVYALAGFFNTTLGSGQVPTIGAPSTNAAGLNSAMDHTIPALINLATGSPNATATSGTLTTTTEAAKLNSLANSLAACVNTTGQTSTTETTTNCGKLFGYTAPATGTRPSDTVQAALRIALFPYIYVTNIYSLAAGTSAPFVGLSTTPNDWTLGISYTSTNFGLGISGTSTSRTSSNIDIDALGRIWFPSNMSSSHGLGVFDPSLQAFSGPYATTLTDPQYIAIDRSGTVWGDDLSNSHIAGINSALSNVTTYPTAGPTGPLSISNAASADSIQIIVNSNALYYETGGTVAAAQGETYNHPVTGISSYPESSNSQSADAATSGSSTSCYYENSYSNHAAVIRATSSSPCFSGANINTTELNDELITASSVNQVCDFDGSTCFTPAAPVSIPEGLALDGGGNIWFANSGNASVSTLAYVYSAANSTDYHATATVAYIHDSTNGNTLTTPFGIAVDNSGNVWVSNASCINTGSGCTPSGFTLSEIVGAAAPTITPLAVQTLNSTGGSKP